MLLPPVSTIINPVMKHSHRLIFSLIHALLPVLFLLACTARPADGLSADAGGAALSTAPPPVSAQRPGGVATADVVPATPLPTVTPAPTPFCVLWLSDTQLMAYKYPSALSAMGEWIAANRMERNIVQAVQTGDAVEHGANNAQWAAVDRCLNAFRSDIPYFAIAGNHELGVREKDYAWFLDRPYIRALPTGQAFEDGKAAYSTFHAGGRDFLVLGAGWNAELAAVDWMNGVLAAHRNHIAILLFHGFMDRQGELTRIGRQLYPAVIEPNPNVRMVLCGHIPGHYSRTDTLDDDGDGAPERKVHIMLFNFQHYTDRCGQLRLLTFDPSAGSVAVETYSPVTDAQYRSYPYREPVYTVEGLF